MRVITLDAANWKSIDDFYDALLTALQAPAYHGRNLDALNDSIFGGDINGVEPPFHIRIIGAKRITNDALRAHLRRFRKLIAEESTARGIDVQFSTNASIDD